MKAHTPFSAAAGRAVLLPNEVTLMRKPRLPVALDYHALAFIGGFAAIFGLAAGIPIIALAGAVLFAIFIWIAAGR